VPRSGRMASASWAVPRRTTPATHHAVIKAKNGHSAAIGGITGSDEVWYCGRRRALLHGLQPGVWTAGWLSGAACGAVLGVIDAKTNLLMETIPQISELALGAADSSSTASTFRKWRRLAVIRAGGDTTTVGAGICGSNNGCVAGLRRWQRQRAAGWQPLASDERRAGPA